jgi:hypothetical protein
LCCLQGRYTTILSPVSSDRLSSMFHALPWGNSSQSIRHASQVGATKLLSPSKPGHCPRFGHKCCTTPNSTRSCERSACLRKQSATEIVEKVASFRAGIKPNRYARVLRLTKIEMRLCSSRRSSRLRSWCHDRSAASSDTQTGFDTPLRSRVQSIRLPALPLYSVHSFCAK